MLKKTIAKFNDETTFLDELKIPVSDRGYFFGDGIYEVIPIYNGVPFLWKEHFARLKRSLAEMRIECTVAEVESDTAKNIKDNQVKNGISYLQITRGTQQRSHTYSAALKSNRLIYSHEVQQNPYEAFRQDGIKVVTTLDKRWGRCDIKSINLLANCMAKQEALEQGCQEALMIDSEGFLTEGTTCNVFIVKGGKLLTPPLSSNILAGVTRGYVTRLIAELKIPFEERRIVKPELFSADEVFVTSSSAEVLAVSSVDSIKIGHSPIGPITLKLQSIFRVDSF